MLLKGLLLSMPCCVNIPFLAVGNFALLTVETTRIGLKGNGGQMGHTLLRYLFFPEPVAFLNRVLSIVDFRRRYRKQGQKRASV